MLSPITFTIRGILQAYSKFDQMTKAEFVSRWIIFIPLISIGIYYNSPYLSWSGFIIVELFELTFFSNFLFKLTREIKV